jgi:predicted amidophosphoribosyltransferase
VRASTRCRQRATLVGMPPHVLLDIGRALPVLVTAVVDIARLVVPVECPGCGLKDVRWCEDCAAVWWEAPLRCDSGAPRLQRAGPALPVWSIAPLESTAHGMVAAWKDGGRRDLDRFFAAAVTRQARAIAERLPERVDVVPAPARPASTRSRGVDLPMILARAVASEFAASGRDARATRALRIGAGQSRGASSRGRWSQAATSVVLVRHPRAAAAVVLVDDVLTTGATLAACRTAVESPTSPVVAALVLAHASAPASAPTRTLTHDVARVGGPG